MIFDEKKQIMHIKSERGAAVMNSVDFNINFDVETHGF